MKTRNKILLFVMMFVITFLIVIIPVGASTTADIVDESQSWLARQLETYGVPSAIAAIIASLGTYLAIFLGTRGFKKSKGTMIAALEKIGLSADTLNNVLEKIDLVEKRLEEVEFKSQKNMEITYQERVIPLLQEVKDMQAGLKSTVDQIKNGALRAVNLLSEPIENDKETEV